MKHKKMLFLILVVGFVCSLSFAQTIPMGKLTETVTDAENGPLPGVTVTINAERRGSEKLPDQHLLDVRIEKAFNVWRGQLGFQVDVYNAFNSNQTTSIGATTNWDWFQRANGQRVYGIMGPRYVQLGVVYRF